MPTRAREMQARVDEMVGTGGMAVTVMRGKEAEKLEQLRDDIRQGLNSGPCKAWSAEDAKREGRARRTHMAA
jgi:Arc/MetJ-type ribon-helix-helix transcriptional regulator